MAYLQTKAISHSQKVCSLYKKALRHAMSWYSLPHEFRIKQAELRARFDEHKDERDLVKAKKLLEAGEAEFYKYMHPQPMIFADSPGGVAYNRGHYLPDSIFDTWHPIERLRYPEYFARRHQRKLEYIERWEKKYGKPTKDIKAMEEKYGPLEQ